jgi:hypothetical protein
MVSLFLLISTIVPFDALAGRYPKEITIVNTLDTLNVDSLKLRLDAIAAIDKSEMSKVDKNKLKEEVREIRHKLKEVDRGIYLSLGTVILIVILLIVLA